jgi:hypothetical protein
MRKLTLGALVVGILFLVGPAGAQETVGFAGAHVQIVVPQNWKSMTKANTILLADKGEDVAMSFVAVPAGSLKKASAYAGNALRARIQNLTFKKEERITINGMTGVSFEGDGMMNGVNIDLAVLMLDTPAQDVDLMIFAVAEDAKLAAHKSEIKYVFRNIAPAD